MIRTASLAVTLAVLSAAAVQAADQSRPAGPNVLVILADDMGFSMAEGDRPPNAKGPSWIAPRHGSDT
jgi:hypothetical protein